MIRFAFLLALALPTAAAAVELPRDECHLAEPCSLGGRSYHVQEPDGWDGVTPLPVLLHFHGRWRTGAHSQRSKRVGAAARRRNVLLVTPNGRRKTWKYASANSRDVGFADRVMQDVAQRYPVDQDQIFVSGYSVGAAMAWRYACNRGNDVTALLAVAGTLDQDETCPEAPAEVRHVHGLDDDVIDFPLGPGGDTTYPVALWREAMGCGVGEPQGDWQTKSWLVLMRTGWECDAGLVKLDLHPGGHMIPHGWIGRQLDELLGLTPSYP